MKKVSPKNLAELLAEIKRAKEEGKSVEFINADTGESNESAFMEALAKAASGSAGMVISSDGHRGRDDITKPTADHVHKLLNVVAIHASPPKFAVGSFVRYREDINYVRQARDLHVVAEVLTAPRQVPLCDENDGNCTTYRRYDLMVAKINPMDGTCVYLADSRELEIYPQEEIARLMGKDGVS